MTGGIYRREFEAMKAPHIMWRRVSYMSNGETAGQQKKRCTISKKNVLERLVNVTLMLSKCNLPFHGSSGKLSNDNKGDFLSIMQLLSKYDTV